jgi:hypothetical protein
LLYLPFFGVVTTADLALSLEGFLDLPLLALIGLSSTNATLKNCINTLSFSAFFAYFFPDGMFGHNSFLRHLPGLRIGSICQFLGCTKEVFRCPALVEGIQQSIPRF